MALSKKETTIVNQVTKRYGNVIDLKKSPAVLIEILRNFGGLVEDGGAGGAPGAPPPTPPSTMAVGVAPSPPPAGPSGALTGGFGDVSLPAVMKAVLQVQRDVAAIKQTLAQRAK